MMQVTEAFLVFNSGFLMGFFPTSEAADEYVKQHLSDSPEVEIKRLTTLMSNSDEAAAQANARADRVERELLDAEAEIKSLQEQISGRPTHQNRD